LKDSVMDSRLRGNDINFSVNELQPTLDCRASLAMTKLSISNPNAAACLYV
jgi:hypothetical protein